MTREPRARRSGLTGQDAELAIGILFKPGIDLSRLLFPAAPGGRLDTSGGRVDDAVRAAVKLIESQGFRISGVGMRTLSIRGSIKSLERAYGARVSERAGVKPDPWGRHDWVARGFLWQRMPQLAKVIEAMEIQRPHVYLATVPAAAVPAAQPPATAIPALLLQANVEPLVRGNLPRGKNEGAGIRVAMVDSGFDCRHGFFQSNGFKPLVRLAFMASNLKTDPDGHGTAMSSNFFVLAPQAELVGVKLHNDENPSLSATTLEGIHRAIRMRPRPKVISLSRTIDLRDANGRPASVITGECLILQGEIDAAVHHADPKKRIVFVCSAGNGEFGFPGQMPDVICVGGAFSDAPGQKRSVAAFSSAFTSAAYVPPRVVPDVCGVLGLLPQQTEIMLPVPGGSERDKGNAPADGTAKTDGWTVMGGTSATAPQAAAICAMLLEEHPELGPAEIKKLLVDSAIPVLDGTGAKDARAGAGMINAAAALALAATRFP